MTGPLLIVLHTMPAAVFAGVFFVVGVCTQSRLLYDGSNQQTQWGSIESNGIVAKLIYLQSERRFLQPSDSLTLISRRKVVLYISLQILGVAITVAISQTIAAIGFPVLIIALIPLRTFLMPKWFTRKELSVLDDLTANNKAVLASLGGRPEMAGAEEGEDEEDRRDEGMETQNEEDADLRMRRSRSRSSAVRQRAGSIHR